MGIIAIIGLVLQIAWALLQRWFKATDEQKIRLEDALKKGTDAVKNNDLSGITSFFDHINRMR